MNVNNVQLQNVYNPQKTSGIIKPQKNSSVNPSKAAGPETLNKNSAPQRTDKQNGISEFRKLLSGEEKKMFDLLFPSGGVQDSKKLDEAIAIQKRYDTKPKRAAGKTLGSRFDIRG